MRTRFTPLLFLVLCSSLNAKNIYVSKSGNSQNDGLTPATSLPTLALAVKTAESGDVIMISDGVYQGSPVLDKDLVIIGESAANTILQAKDEKSTIETATLSKPVISLSGTANVKISSLTLRYGHNKNAGGAISLLKGQSLTVEECNIIDNVSALSGGAISSQGNLIVNNSYIANNESKNNGGGIYAGGGTLEVNNSVIYKNKATATEKDATGGGAIYIAKSTSNKLVNNTIAFNESLNNANDGIRIEGTNNVTGKLEMYNNILANSSTSNFSSCDLTANSPVNYGPGEEFQKNNIYTFTFSPFLSTTSIPVKPSGDNGAVFPTLSEIALGEPESGVNGVMFLPIAANSIAVNAGDAATSLATDMFGAARIGLPDIGSYEYDSETSTSIESTESEEKIICPTISNGVFALTSLCPNTITMNVYNLQGQQINALQVEEGTSVVELGVKQGIYILSFITSEGNFTQKHIVE